MTLPTAVRRLARLHAHVTSGRMLLDQACAEAARYLGGEELSESAITAACADATARCAAGAAEDGFALAALLLAASAGRETACRRPAVIAYLTCVIAVVAERDVDVPLFRRAEAVGDELVAESRESDRPEALSEALRLAGTLRVRAVDVGHVKYWDHDRPWQQEAGPSRWLPLQFDEDQYRMTDASAQMRLAYTQLATAVEMTSGRDRGLASLPLLRATVWLASRGELDKAELRGTPAAVAAPRYAATLLDPELDRFLLAETHDVRALLDEPLPLGKHPFERPIDDLVAQFGLRTVSWAAIRRIYTLLMIGNRGAAFELMSLWPDLPMSPPDLPEELSASLLVVATQANDVLVPYQSQADWPTQIESLRRLLSDSDLDAGLVRLVRVSSATHVASHLTYEDADAALELLHRIHDDAEKCSFRFYGPWVMCAAAAWSAKAKRSAAEGDWSTQLQALLFDAAAYMNLNLQGLAAAKLRQMVSVLVVQPEALSVALLEHLWRYTAFFDSAREGDMDLTLHTLGQLAEPQFYLYSNHEYGEYILDVIRHRWAFKAPTFGLLAAHPSAVATDGRLASLLAEAEAAEAELNGEADDPGAVLEPGAAELAALAWAGQREQLPGASAAERLANSRRFVDQHLTRAAVTHPDRHPAYDHRRDAPSSTPVGAVLEATADGTVLLDLFFGTPPADFPISLTRTLLAMDQETGLLDPDSNVVMLRGEFPSRFVIPSDVRGHEVAVHWPAVLVAELRITLQAQSPLRPVSRQAQRLLDQWQPRLLGGDGVEFLTKQREAGATHLCILPHGALMFAPLHLVPADTEGRMIADDWTVTVLPSPQLLAAAPRRPTGHATVAVGCPDGGLSHGFPREDALAVQVAAIAEVIPTDLVRPEAAEPDEVLDRGSRARYLHIAAHGTDYPPAPAFACLYLSRGRLFAHQILGRDLSALDLVTLSACESALGRVDVNDNLYGLSAAFLQAGARAVVAALWPVSPQAGTTFFVSLYERLGRGAEMLDAFRGAQLRTRADHPAYRDWGAFTFVGDWRPRKAWTS